MGVSSEPRSCGESSCTGHRKVIDHIDRADPRIAGYGKAGTGGFADVKEMTGRPRKFAHKHEAPTPIFLHAP